LPKIKLEVVISESIIDRVVSLVIKAAKAGSVRNGKIFIIPVEEAIRIQTEEAGEEAL
jgi:nitrogen regulatory protein P-II 1